MGQEEYRESEKSDINLILREANELQERIELTLGHVQWLTFISAVSSLFFFGQGFGLYNICYIYG